MEKKKKWIFKLREGIIESWTRVTYNETKLSMNLLSFQMQNYHIGNFNRWQVNFGLGDCSSLLHYAQNTKKNDYEDLIP